MPDNILGERAGFEICVWEWCQAIGPVPLGCRVRAHACGNQGLLSEQNGGRQVQMVRVPSKHGVNVEISQVWASPERHTS